MKLKDKILVCLPSLASGDGIAKFYMNYYDELIKEYDIDFFCVINCQYDNKYIEKINKNKGQIFICEKTNILKRYKKTKAMVKEILSLSSYKIIHVNLVNIQSLACIDACDNQVKILHSHNPRTEKNAKTFLLDEIAHQLAITKADKCFACSKEAGDSSFKNRDYVIINNKVHIEKFLFSCKNREEIRRKFNIKKDCLLIGIVGRIVKQKNPFFVISVFEKIIKKNNNIKLIWIGDGNLKNEIQNIIEEKKLNEYIFFEKSNNSIEKYYSAMDAFFLPSKFEGLGLVLIEAQASGLITFTSTNVPNITKITDQIFYKRLQDDIDDWANLMCDKMKINDDLTKRKDYNKIADNSIFSINYEIDKLSKEYSKLIKKGVK